MADFTKGPWEVDLNLKDAEICTLFGAPSTMNTERGEAQKYIQVNASGDKRPSPQEQLANAHLMAAAPDLFEALEGLLEAHGSAYRSAIEMDAAITDAEDAARAALSKARGEPND